MQPLETRNTQEEKAAARVRLEGTFAKVRRHLGETGISQAQWEAAVDEAVQQVRSIL